MPHIRRLAFAVAFLSSAVAFRATAQAGSAYRFGAMGGPAYPSGDLNSFTNSGWNAGLLLNFGLPLVPLGFRVDAQWTQMGGQQLGVPGGGTVVPTLTDSRVFDGTFDVTYTIFPAAFAKFYLIGGIGIYNVDRSVKQTSSGASDESESITKIGFNGGVGLRIALPVITPFVEVRYHYVSNGLEKYGANLGGLEFVPISFGVIF